MERAADLECNICCGSAEDPVITLCGHLHCRPCLHGRDECPVCKAAIKEEELIPLHGSGSTPRRPSGGLLWRRRGFIPVAQVQVGVATDQRQSVRLPDAQSGVSGYGSFGEGEQSNNNNGHYLKKILLFILVFVVFDFLII